MKKLFFTALCLVVFATGIVAKSETSNLKFINVLVDDNNNRKAIKFEDLPEAVRKAIAVDAYKDWKVIEAFIVNGAVAADGTKGPDHYELKLSKDTEKKSVKFNTDGTLLI